MGIRVFEKNKIDLDRGSVVSMTVTDGTATDTGQDFVDYLRNRRNDSGWATSGSADAANTQLEVNAGESSEIDTIILVSHNFKAYGIEYHNGTTWAALPTPVAVTGNSRDVGFHQFTPLELSRIRLTITETMVADDDKFLAQIILTKQIHEFQHELGVTNLRVGKNRRVLRTNSGRGKVMRSEGAVSMSVRGDRVTNLSDLAAFESLFDYHNGFLVWLCGGTVTQFRDQTPRIGWREKDLYLMNCVNELETAFHEGLYENGVPVQLDLLEVI